MELKPWVSSRGCQCALQAITTLMRDHAIDPHAITAIRLHLSNTYTRNTPWMYEPAPNNYWEAIYSTQWAAAMVLQRIPSGPKWVTNERLADPFSRHLAAMVEIIEDPEATRAHKAGRREGVRGTVVIDCRGETYQAVCGIRATYGSPGVNMPEAMVEEKFMEATSLSLSPERARGILAALRRIEEVNDINDLASLF